MGGAAGRPAPRGPPPSPGSTPPARGPHRQPGVHPAQGPHPQPGVHPPAQDLLQPAVHLPAQGPPPSSGSTPPAWSPPWPLRLEPGPSVPLSERWDRAWQAATSRVCFQSESAGKYEARDAVLGGAVGALWTRVDRTRPSAGEPSVRPGPGAFTEGRLGWRAGGQACPWSPRREMLVSSGGEAW